MPVCSEDLENKLIASLNMAVPRSKTSVDERTPAAVLVPFICIDEKWHLLYTKRTDGVAKHRGEISFPGGAVESSDADQVKTALRETFEEIGIPETKIRILGAIDPVPTISNFCVLSVVGVIDWPVPLAINPDEVDKVILIPVEWLSDPENWYENDYQYEPGSFRRVIHYQDYNNEHLWGLTAMITRKVLDLL